MSNSRGKPMPRRTEPRPGCSAIDDRTRAMRTSSAWFLSDAIAAHAPNFATRARQYVGGVVTYIVQNGLLKDGATSALRGLVPRRKKGHIPAIIKPADIAPLAPAINACKSPITRAALKLTMLTGLRSGVVAAAPCDEANLKTAEWHVAAERMKMPHDHIVALRCDKRSHNSDR
jgi:hypothetical protein